MYFQPLRRGHLPIKDKIAGPKASFIYMFHFNNIYFKAMYIVHVHSVHVIKGVSKFSSHVDHPKYLRVPHVLHACASLSAHTGMMCMHTKHMVDISWIHTHTHKYSNCLVCVVKISVELTQTCYNKPHLLLRELGNLCLQIFHF